MSTTQDVFEIGHGTRLKIGRLVDELKTAKVELAKAEKALKDARDRQLPARDQAAAAVKQARIALGRELIPIKAACPTGTRGIWDTKLEQLGINRNTASSAIRAAKAELGLGLEEDETRKPRRNSNATNPGTAHAMEGVCSGGSLGPVDYDNLEAAIAPGILETLMEDEEEEQDAKITGPPLRGGIVPTPQKQSSTGPAEVMVPLSPVQLELAGLYEEAERAAESVQSLLSQLRAGGGASTAGEWKRVGRAILAIGRSLEGHGV